MRTKPIFIFSLPRSGSTLLQRLLATHSKISTAPEPWLLLPFCYATKTKGIFSEYDHGTACRALGNLIDKLPQRRDDYYAALGQMASGLYAKLSDEDSIYFLDKTPRYYLIVNEIAKIFPQAKFIFLFRNPLQVFASVINTWYNGRFRIERHYLDLYSGPQMLAESYSLLRQRSIRILFEDLIDTPENALRQIFEYLDLEEESEVLENFHTKQFDGDLGDRKGYYLHNKIDSKIHHGWKKTISTRYRKKIFLQYLACLSPQTLEVFGTSHQKLNAAIDDIKPHKSGFFKDRSDFLLSRFFRIFEIPLFMRKIKVRLEHGNPFVAHR